MEERRKGTTLSALAGTRDIPAKKLHAWRARTDGDRELRKSLTYLWLYGATYRDMLAFCKRRRNERSERALVRTGLVDPKTERKSDGIPGTIAYPGGIAVCNYAAVYLAEEQVPCDDSLGLQGWDYV